MGLLSTAQLPHYLVLLFLSLSLLFLVLTLSLTRDGSVLSFTHFNTLAAGGVLSYSLGYSSITECWHSTVDPALDACSLQSLHSYDVALGGVCHRGGVGLISMYSIAVVALVASLALHLCSGRVTSALQGRCSALCSALTVATGLSLVSLTFATVPMAVWYSTCQATLSGASVTYAGDEARTRWPINDLRVGGGMALAIIAATMALVVVALSGWRLVEHCRAGRAAVVSVGDEELLPAAKWGKLQADSGATSVTITTHCVVDV